jgi:hypothetical protein
MKTYARQTQVRIRGEKRIGGHYLAIGNLSVSGLACIVASPLTDLCCLGIQHCLGPSSGCDVRHILAFSLPTHSSRLESDRLEDTEIYNLRYLYKKSFFNHSQNISAFFVSVGTNFADKLRSLGRTVRLRTKATEFSFLLSQQNL